MKAFSPLLSPPAKSEWAVTSILIASLLVIRAASQAYLYQSGFDGFHADEFIRIFKAIWWAEKPGFFIHRGSLVSWLPFPIALTGIALKLNGNLLITPRAISAASGALSILLIYLFTRTLFASRAAGFISALFLTANPVHLWLSSTALSETPYLAALLAFLFFFTLYLRRAKMRDLYLGAAALTIASGTRYEAWLVAAVFTPFLAAITLGGRERRSPPAPPFAFILPAGVIPWVFPVAWMIFTYNVSGSPVGFVSTHKLLTGAQPAPASYQPYWTAVVAIDPYGFFLGLAGCLFCCLRNRRGRAVQFYLLSLIIPFLILAALQGGERLVETTYLRNLSPYLFLLYPAAAYLLSRGLTPAGGRFRRRALPAVTLLAVAAVTFIQIQRAFTAPFARKNYFVKAGEKLGGLRNNLPGLRERAVLMEFSPPLLEKPGWGRMALQVGANDVGLPAPLLDRESDGEPSLFLATPEAIRNFLIERRVGLIVIHDAYLRREIERKLGLSPIETTNHYAFYLAF